MTKKHFQALAEFISRIADLEARTSAAYAVAGCCKQFNARFDEKRFIKSCVVAG